jgi:hypothetical protein
MPKPMLTDPDRFFAYWAAVSAITHHQILTDSDFPTGGTSSAEIAQIPADYEFPQTSLTQTSRETNTQVASVHPEFQFLR